MNRRTTHIHWIATRLVGWLWTRVSLIRLDTLFGLPLELGCLTALQLINHFYPYGRLSSRGISPHHSLRLWICITH
jgi:hypothetical protein